MIIDLNSLKMYKVIVITLIIIQQLSFNPTESLPDLTCSEKFGSNYRCVTPEVCNAYRFRAKGMDIHCGPNGEGVCCPVVSPKSQPRCGIRKKSIEYRENLGHEDSTEMNIVSKNAKTDFLKFGNKNAKDVNTKNAIMSVSGNSVMNSTEDQIKTHQLKFNDLNNDTLGYKSNTPAEEDYNNSTDFYDLSVQRTTIQEDIYKTISSISIEDSGINGAFTRQNFSQELLETKLHTSDYIEQTTDDNSTEIELSSPVGSDPSDNSSVNGIYDKVNKDVVEYLKVNEFQNALSNYNAYTKKEDDISQPDESMHFFPTSDSEVHNSFNPVDLIEIQSTTLPAYTYIDQRTEANTTNLVLSRPLPLLLSDISSVKEESSSRNDQNISEDLQMTGFQNSNSYYNNYTENESEIMQFDKLKPFLSTHSGTNDASKSPDIKMAQKSRFHTDSYNYPGIENKYTQLDVSRPVISRPTGDSFLKDEYGNKKSQNISDELPVKGFQNSTSYYNTYRKNEEEIMQSENSVLFLSTQNSGVNDTFNPSDIKMIQGTAYHNNIYIDEEAEDNYTEVFRSVFSSSSGDSSLIDEYGNKKSQNISDDDEGFQNSTFYYNIYTESEIIQGKKESENVISQLEKSVPFLSTQNSGVNDTFNPSDIKTAQGTTYHTLPFIDKGTENNYTLLVVSRPVLLRASGDNALKNEYGNEKHQNTSEELQENGPQKSTSYYNIYTENKEEIMLSDNSIPLPSTQNISENDTFNSPNIKMVLGTTYYTYSYIDNRTEDNYTQLEVSRPVRSRAGDSSSKDKYDNEKHQNISKELQVNGFQNSTPYYNTYTENEDNIQSEKSMSFISIHDSSENDAFNTSDINMVHGKIFHTNYADQVTESNNAQLELSSPVSPRLSDNSSIKDEYDNEKNQNVSEELQVSGFHTDTYSDQRTNDNDTQINVSRTVLSFPPDDISLKDEYAKKQNISEELHVNRFQNRTTYYNSYAENEDEIIYLDSSRTSNVVADNRYTRDKYKTESVLENNFYKKNAVTYFDSIYETTSELNYLKPEIMTTVFPFTTNNINLNNVFNVSDQYRNSERITTEHVKSTFDATTDKLTEKNSLNVVFSTMSPFAVKKVSIKENFNNTTGRNMKEEATFSVTDIKTEESVQSGIFKSTISSIANNRTESKIFNHSTNQFLSTVLVKNIVKGTIFYETDALKDIGDARLIESTSALPLAFENTYETDDTSIYPTGQYKNEEAMVSEFHLKTSVGNSSVYQDKISNTVSSNISAVVDNIAEIDDDSSSLYKNDSITGNETDKNISINYNDDSFRKTVAPQEREKNSSDDVHTFQTVTMFSDAFRMQTLDEKNNNLEDSTLRNDKTIIASDLNDNNFTQNVGVQHMTNCKECGRTDTAFTVMNLESKHTLENNEHDSLQRAKHTQKPNFVILTEFELEQLMSTDATDVYVEMVSGSLSHQHPTPMYEFSSTYPDASDDILKLNYTKHIEKLSFPLSNASILAYSNSGNTVPGYKIDSTNSPDDILIETDTMNYTRFDSDYISSTDNPFSSFFKENFLTSSNSETFMREKSQHIPGTKRKYFIPPDFSAKYITKSLQTHINGEVIFKKGLESKEDNLELNYETSVQDANNKIEITDRNDLLFETYDGVSYGIKNHLATESIPVKPTTQELDARTLSQQSQTEDLNLLEMLKNIKNLIWALGFNITSKLENLHIHFEKEFEALKNNKNQKTSENQEIDSNLKYRHSYSTLFTTPTESPVLPYPTNSVYYPNHFHGIHSNQFKRYGYSGMNQFYNNLPSNTGFQNIYYVPRYSNTFNGRPRILPIYRMHNPSYSYYHPHQQPRVPYYTNFYRRNCNVPACNTYWQYRYPVPFSRSQPIPKHYIHRRYRREIIPNSGKVLQKPEEKDVTLITKDKEEQNSHRFFKGFIPKRLKKVSDSTVYSKVLQHNSENIHYKVNDDTKYRSTIISLMTFPASKNFRSKIYSEKMPHKSIKRRKESQLKLQKFTVQTLNSNKFRGNSNEISNRNNLHSEKYLGKNIIPVARKLLNWKSKKSSRRRIQSESIEDKDETLHRILFPDNDKDYEKSNSIVGYKAASPDINNDEMHYMMKVHDFKRNEENSLQGTSELLKIDYEDENVDDDEPEKNYEDHEEETSNNRDYDRHEKDCGKGKLPKITYKKKFQKVICKQTTSETSKQCKTNLRIKMLISTAVTKNADTSTGSEKASDGSSKGTSEKLDTTSEKSTQSCMETTENKEKTSSSCISTGGSEESTDGGESVTESKQEDTTTRDESTTKSNHEDSIATCLDKESAEASSSDSGAIEQSTTESKDDSNHIGICLDTKELTKSSSTQSCMETTENKKKTSSSCISTGGSEESTDGGESVTESKQEDTTTRDESTTKSKQEDTTTRDESTTKSKDEDSIATCLDKESAEASSSDSGKGKLPKITCKKKFQKVTCKQTTSETSKQCKTNLRIKMLISTAVTKNADTSTGSKKASDGSSKGTSEKLDTTSEKSTQSCMETTENKEKTSSSCISTGGSEESTDGGKSVTESKQEDTTTRDESTTKSKHEDSIATCLDKESAEASSSDSGAIEQSTTESKDDSNHIGICLDTKELTKSSSTQSCMETTENKKKTSSSCISTGGSEESTDGGESVTESKQEDTTTRDESTIKSKQEDTTTRDESTTKSKQEDTTTRDESTTKSKDKDSIATCLDKESAEASSSDSRAIGQSTTESKDDSNHIGMCLDTEELTKSSSSDSATIEHRKQKNSLTQSITLSKNILTNASELNSELKAETSTTEISTAIINGFNENTSEGRGETFSEKLDATSEKSTESSKQTTGKDDTTSSSSISTNVSENSTDGVELKTESKEEAPNNTTRLDTPQFMTGTTRNDQSTDKSVSASESKEETSIDTTKSLETAISAARITGRSSKTITNVKSTPSIGHSKENFPLSQNITLGSNIITDAVESNSELMSQYTYSQGSEETSDNSGETVSDKFATTTTKSRESSKETSGSEDETSPSIISAGDHSIDGGKPTPESNQKESVDTASLDTIPYTSATTGTPSNDKSSGRSDFTNEEAASMDITSLETNVFAAGATETSSESISNTKFITGVEHRKEKFPFSQNVTLGSNIITDALESISELMFEYTESQRSEEIFDKSGKTTSEELGTTTEKSRESSKEAFGGEDVTISNSISRGDSDQSIDGHILTLESNLEELFDTTSLDTTTSTSGTTGTVPNGKSSSRSDPTNENAWSSDTTSLKMTVSTTKATGTSSGSISNAKSIPAFEHRKENFPLRQNITFGSNVLTDASELNSELKSEYVESNGFGKTFDDSDETSSEILNTTTGKSGESLKEATGSKDAISISSLRGGSEESTAGGEPTTELKEEDSLSLDTTPSTAGITGTLPNDKSSGRGDSTNESKEAGSLDTSLDTIVPTAGRIGTTSENVLISESIPAIEYRKESFPFSENITLSSNVLTDVPESHNELKLEISTAEAFIARKYVSDGTENSSDGLRETFPEIFDRMTGKSRQSLKETSESKDATFSSSLLRDGSYGLTDGGASIIESKEVDSNYTIISLDVIPFTAGETGTPLNDKSSGRSESANELKEADSTDTTISLETATYTTITTGTGSETVSKAISVPATGHKEENSSLNQNVKLSSNILTYVSESNSELKPDVSTAQTSAVRKNVSNVNEKTFDDGGKTSSEILDRKSGKSREPLKEATGSIDATSSSTILTSGSEESPNRGEPTTESKQEDLKDTTSLDITLSTARTTGTPLNDKSSGRSYSTNESQKTDSTGNTSLAMTASIAGTTGTNFDSISNAKSVPSIGYIENFPLSQNVTLGSNISTDASELNTELRPDVLTSKPSSTRKRVSNDSENTSDGSETPDIAPPEKLDTSSAGTVTNLEATDTTTEEIKSLIVHESEPYTKENIHRIKKESLLFLDETLTTRKYLAEDRQVYSNILLTDSTENGPITSDNALKNLSSEYIFPLLFNIPSSDYQGISVTLMNPSKTLSLEPLKNANYSFSTKERLLTEILGDLNSIQNTQASSQIESKTLHTAEDYSLKTNGNAGVTDNPSDTEEHRNSFGVRTKDNLQMSEIQLDSESASKSKSEDLDKMYTKNPGLEYIQKKFLYPGIIPPYKTFKEKTEISYERTEGKNLDEILSKTSVSEASKKTNDITEIKDIVFETTNPQIFEEGYASYGGGSTDFDSQVIPSEKVLSITESSRKDLFSDLTTDTFVVTSITERDNSDSKMRSNLPLLYRYITTTYKDGNGEDISTSLSDIHTKNIFYKMPVINVTIYSDKSDSGESSEIGKVLSSSDVDTFLSFNEVNSFGYNHTLDENIGITDEFINKMKPIENFTIGNIFTEKRTKVTTNITFVNFENQTQNYVFNHKEKFSDNDNDTGSSESPEDTEEGIAVVDYSREGNNFFQQNNVVHYDENSTKKENTDGQSFSDFDAITYEFKTNKITDASLKISDKSLPPPHRQLSEKSITFPASVNKTVSSQAFEWFPGQEFKENEDLLNKTVPSNKISIVRDNHTSYTLPVLIKTENIDSKNNKSKNNYLATISENVSIHYKENITRNDPSQVSNKILFNETKIPISEQQENLDIFLTNKSSLSFDSLPLTAPIEKENYKPATDELKDVIENNKISTLLIKDVEKSTQYTSDLPVYLQRLQSNASDEKQTERTLKNNLLHSLSKSSSNATDIFQYLTSFNINNSSLNDGFNTFGEFEHISENTDRSQIATEKLDSSTKLDDLVDDSNAINFVTSLEMLPLVRETYTKKKSLIYDYITKNRELGFSQDIIYKNNSISKIRNSSNETTHQNLSVFTEKTVKENDTIPYTSGANVLTLENKNLLASSMSNVDGRESSKFYYDMYTKDRSQYKQDSFRDTNQVTNQTGMLSEMMLNPVTDYNNEMSKIPKNAFIYLYRNKSYAAYTKAQQDSTEEIKSFDSPSAINYFTTKDSLNVDKTAEADTDIQETAETIFVKPFVSTSSSVTQYLFTHIIIPKPTPEILNGSNKNFGKDFTTSKLNGIKSSVYHTFSSEEDDIMPSVRENLYSTTQGNGHETTSDIRFSAPASVNFSSDNIQVDSFRKNMPSSLIVDEHYSTDLFNASKMARNGRYINSTSLPISKILLERAEQFPFPTLIEGSITENGTNSEDDWLSKPNIYYSGIQKVTEYSKYARIADSLERADVLSKPTDSVLASDLHHETEPDAEFFGPEDIEYSRTIGGRLEYDSWPWMVSIYKESDMSFICGGTLIDDRHILSAAHCFYEDPKETRYIVSIGKLLKISRSSEGFLVDQVIIHEGFQFECYCNDVAVLRLKVRLGPQYVPICLPEFDSAVVGDNATLLGWGDTSYHGGQSSIRLQRVDNLPIVSSRECRRIISRIVGREVSKGFEDYYLCAGVADGSKDACLGDSGGPLLHEDYEGIWTLLGIVSFGYKCGEPGVPGTYSRVSYYLPWILSVTET